MVFALTSFPVRLPVHGDLIQSRRGSIHPQFETASAAARQIDPKELAKRRKQEERGLRKRLRKDDGKTLGAKYLLKTTAKDRVDHDEVPIRHSKRSRDESTPPGDSPPARGRH